jgi:phospholipid/cholesterol/gamma-HCH transport system ATP-binding protein
VSKSKRTQPSAAARQPAELAAEPAASSSQHDVVVRVDDVHKAFGQHEVLRGVSFEVRRGRCLGIMGGSGTGKSVLLRHVIGLMKPDKGRVEVLGRDVPSLTGEELAEMRRHMGYVFQEGALVAWLTINENLALPLKENTKLSNAEIADLVAEKLALVRIPDAGAKFPSEISGGMKKRVGIARALITDPDLVLYDEPNAGLDPEISRAINDLIREVSDSMGTTALVVEHRVECIQTVCDEVVFLHEGVVAVHAPIAEFFHTDHPRLVQFLGPDHRADKGATVRP